MAVDDASATGIRPILGTMTFGVDGQVAPNAVGVILRSFCGTGCAKTPDGVLVDTARIYQSANPDGDTESTLGQIFMQFPSLQSKCSVATKANNGMEPHFSLSKQSIIDQGNTSLEKLDSECIDLFYLHGPDIKTDIEDTLSGVDELHRAGKIKEFGLSNYPAWAVVDIWYRCKARGMVLPTVYQGMYNVITRDMEREIVPVARQFGLRLYMYNPLAGGLLSGRYQTVEDLANATEGRFSAQFDQAFGSKMKAGTEVYRGRYSKGPIFDGLEILSRVCAPAVDAASAEKKVTVTNSVVDGRKVRVEITETTAPVDKGLDMANVALRWLLHHSCLTSGDGIILGVSKNAHLVANLAAWQSGPLSVPVLEACEKAWEASRPACESYFRGFGAKPGGIEKFLELKKRQSESSKEAESESPAKKLKT